METDVIGHVSVSINAPAAKVWQALTDPKLIKQYFFGTEAKSDWKPGSPITFEGEWEGKKYRDKGTVLKDVQHKLLSYSYWSSMSGMEDKPENYVVVTYNLEEKDGKTQLTVTQENIPNEKMREHSEQNWKQVLDGLKKLVEK